MLSCIIDSILDGHEYSFDGIIGYISIHNESLLYLLLLLGGIHQAQFLLEMLHVGPWESLLQVRVEHPSFVLVRRD